MTGWLRTSSVATKRSATSAAPSSSPAPVLARSAFDRRLSASSYLATLLTLHDHTIAHPEPDLQVVHTSSRTVVLWQATLDPPN